MNYIVYGCDKVLSMAMCMDVMKYCDGCDEVLYILYGCGLCFLGFKFLVVLVIHFSVIFSVYMLIYDNSGLGPRPS
jgi:hypothetical protein